MHVRLQVLLVRVLRVARFVAHFTNRYFVSQLRPNEFVNFPLVLQRAGSSSEWLKKKSPKSHANFNKTLNTPNLMTQLALKLFTLHVPMAGTVFVPGLHRVERLVARGTVQRASLAAWLVALQTARLVEAL